MPRRRKPSFELGTRQVFEPAVDAWPLNGTAYAQHMHTCKELRSSLDCHIRQKLRKDSSGIAFGCEIFHVAVPSLSLETEHLIGITQVPS